MPPTAHPLEIQNAWAEDVPVPCLPKDDVFRNAPDLLAWLRQEGVGVVLYCLDHDLVPLDRVGAPAVDPGSGAAPNLAEAIDEALSHWRARGIDPR